MIDKKDMISKVSKNLKALKKYSTECGEVREKLLQEPHNSELYNKRNELEKKELIATNNLLYVQQQLLSIAEKILLDNVNKPLGDATRKKIADKITKEIEEKSGVLTYCYITREFNYDNDIYFYRIYLELKYDETRYLYNLNESITTLYYPLTNKEFNRYYNNAEYVENIDKYYNMITKAKNDATTKIEKLTKEIEDIKSTYHEKLSGLIRYNNNFKIDK